MTGVTKISNHAPSHLTGIWESGSVKATLEIDDELSFQQRPMTRRNQSISGWAEEAGKRHPALAALSGSGYWGDQALRDRVKIRNCDGDGT
jgi:hypothetical protein